MGEFAEDALDRDIGAMFDVLNNLTQFSPEECEEAQEDYDAACAAMHMSNGTFDLTAPLAEDIQRVAAEAEVAITRVSNRSARQRLAEIERRAEDDNAQEKQFFGDSWFKEEMPPWAK